MDSKPNRKPSLAERAAYLRRVQSRKRTLDVSRTPNTPLAPSMVNARDALEVAWAATQDVRPESEPYVSPARPAWKPTHYVERFNPARRDDYGPIYKGSDVTRYGTQYRTRLTGKGRKTYVRNDAWARARSEDVGLARLYGIGERRAYVYVKAESVRGVGSGPVPMSWDELHNPEAMALRRAKRYSATRDKDLWLRYRTRDDAGRTVEYTAHAETGEMRGGYRIVP